MNRLPATPIAILGAVLLLAGCVSAPVPPAPDQPWQPPADALKPDPVWPAVRSNAVLQTRPLTLAELADLALRTHPASRVVWLEARAAAEQVVNAEGYFMPKVSATLGATRQYVTAEPKEGGPMPFGSDFLKYGPGLQVNYLVLNFGGGRQAAVEQALQTVHAADFAFNRALQTILVAVESAYYGLVSANAAAEAAGAAVQDAEAILAAADMRNRSGTGTQLEVLQAQAGLDQARYGLASARGQVLIARGGLARAVNLPADTPLQIVAPAGDVPPSLRERDVRRLIDDAMERRPDIAALRAQAAAQAAAVDVADAADWPNLVLTGGVGRNEYENYGSSFLQDNDWAASAGVSVQWSLFNGYQNRSARRIARLRAEAALEQLRTAELAAGADVWAKFQTYETALEKHAASQALLRSATAAHALALDSYKAGLKSLLDLLGAEALLAQARGQQVAARQEVFTALANLAYATGLLEQGGTTGGALLHASPTTKGAKP